jgi:hypothetical protein
MQVEIHKDCFGLIKKAKFYRVNKNIFSHGAACVCVKIAKIMKESYFSLFSTPF